MIDVDRTLGLIGFFRVHRHLRSARLPLPITCNYATFSTPRPSPLLILLLLLFSPFLLPWVIVRLPC